MLVPGFQIDMILVYFFYGLAFFSMGLAIMLEFGRSPLLAEARVLRPLAAFGILHGVHEWLEIFILQNNWLEIPIQPYWFWIRLGLLAVSFASLVAYGVQVLRPPKRLAATDAWVGAGLLTLYAALVIFTGATIWGDFALWIGRADVLARYMLAVPGGFLAAVALFYQGRQAKASQRDALSGSLYWAAIGFVFYALTQIFVSDIDFFPASVINVTWFISFLGIPIQVVRAVLAAMITASLMRATQIVEKERQHQLAQAQRDRLDAMERAQDELVKREALQKQLLRHTVIAQEEERSRISRELHDELAQTLTGFSLDLATLKNRRIGDEVVDSAISRLQELSRQMAKGLYRLVHDLRPAQLDDLGLVPALEHLVDDVRDRLALEVRLDVNGYEDRLDPLVETVFFRISQEALTNIARHAKTNQAFVSLECRSKEALLIIQDKGIGFDSTVVEQLQDGLGIAGMRERVRSVDGQFILESTPDEGTKIEVLVPCMDPTDMES
ncbi:MAG: sensor histidine kinase [Anaerolineales bacterium]|nr:sensor histidine kinase [Chloroflexota bacterium]MBL6979942.1 sensor histidine kinase [Anaerolineales bacterium]